jgi:trk system potassium uptake protein TrkA
MNIIVVGCGRVGSELAYNLYRRGHKVVVLDQNPDAFQNLPSDFRGRTMAGDVLNKELLLRAGIDNTDALAAVTPVDSVNAVIAHTARVVWNVKNIVVRDYEPAKRGLHEAFGYQMVSPSVWGAQRIEEMLSGGALRTVFSAGNGEVEVYEFTVPDAWHGKHLAELLHNGTCQPVAVSRAGSAMLPSPSLPVQAGDVIHVSATQEGIEALRLRLAETANRSSGAKEG